MSTLKGRNAHKGRTFGGVAACPHCSAPIRVFVTAARVQCVLDVVACSYSLPTPPKEAVELDRPAGVLAVSARVVEQGDTVVVGADAPSTDANVPVVVHHSETRGWDDDEDPVPSP